MQIVVVVVGTDGGAGQHWRQQVTEGGPAASKADVHVNNVYPRAKKETGASHAEATVGEIVYYYTPWWWVRGGSTAGEAVEQCSLHKTHHQQQSLTHALTAQSRLRHFTS